MGKSIVIKNANFSQVSVGTVTFDERDLINFDNLTRENYFTSSGNYVDTPSCYFIQPNGNKFGVKANQTNPASIIFLKSRPSSVSDPIDRCDMTQMEYWNASAQLLVVPAEEDALWDIPSDCTYIYVGSQTISFGDYTPEEAWWEE